MKKVILITMLLLMAAASAHAYNITWSKTNGPYGGYFLGPRYFTTPGSATSILLLPPGGLLIATFEGGASFDREHITLYRATRGRGVATSRNGGVTWEMMDPTDTSNDGLSSKTVTALAFNPVNSRMIFAGTLSTGLYVTSNEGISWKRSLDPLLQSERINGLAVSSSEVYVSYGDSAGEYGIAKAPLSTLSFTSIEGGVYGPNSNDKIFQLAYDDVNRVLFACRHGGPYIWRSTDEGTSWRSVEVLSKTSYGGNYSNNLSMIIQIYPKAASSEIYGWRYDDPWPQMWRSTNGGASWMTQSNLAKPSIVMSPSNSKEAYYFAQDLFYDTVYPDNSPRVIYRTIDGGAAWNVASSNLPVVTSSGPIHYVCKILPNPNPGGESAVFVQSSNGLYVSTDGGGTWLEANGQDNPGQSFVNISVKCLAIGSDEVLYAGGWVRDIQSVSPGDGDGVFRSTDDGYSWKRIQNGLLGTAADSIVVDQNNIVYLANQNGVFKSLNKGGYWETCSYGLGDPDVNALVIDQDNNVYAGTNSLGVYKLTNSGGVSQWQAITLNGMLDPVITALAVFSGEAIYAGTFDGGIYRLPLTNATSWEELDAPSGGTVPGPINAIAVDPYDSNYIYIGNNSGFYRTTDGGTTWTHPAGVGVVNSIYIDKDTSPPTVYAATMVGIKRNNYYGTPESWETTGTPGTDYSANEYCIARDETTRTFFAGGDVLGVSKGIPQVSLPNAPDAFRGSAESSTSIRWRWTDTASDEFGYRVRASGTDAIIASLPMNSQQYLESGIAPNTPCSRYAQVYNNVGPSSSLTSSECTWANAPTNLRSILPIGGNYVTLNWDTSSNTSGTKYVVMLATLEGGPFIDYVSFETNPAQSIEGLTPNRAYWFKVYAINHNGITTEVSNIASAETTHETNPPRIYNIRFDGIPLFDNDVIRSNPLITADITDEAVSPEAFSPVSKEATTLDFSTYYIILGADLNSFTFSTAEGVYKLSHRLSVPLGAGSYTFYITAADALGNVGTSTPRRVRVMSGGVATVGPVLTTPTPFKPATEGGMATIAYTLSTDAPVDIYMYDIAGKIVLRRKFEASTNGGRTGYNEVKWNGTSDFGKVVGNGIYVYKIISKKKVIGKGKIVVYD